MEEEYKALRDEMLESYDKLTYFDLVTVTATATILTVGIKNPGATGLIFLIPLVVIVPNGFCSGMHVESMMKIGRYLQVFHEEATESPGWETRVQAVRTEQGSIKSFLMIIVVSSLYVSLGLVCTLSFLAYSTFDLFIKLGIVFCLVLCLGWMEAYIVFAYRSGEKWADIWRDQLAKERKVKQLTGADNAK